MTKYVLNLDPDAEAAARARAHQLVNATPTQINNWIDANVTDLQSARDALKILAVIVSQLARRANDG